MRIAKVREQRKTVLIKSPAAIYCFVYSINFEHQIIAESNAVEALRMRLIGNEKYLELVFVFFFCSHFVFVVSCACVCVWERECARSYIRFRNYEYTECGLQVNRETHTRMVTEPMEIRKCLTTTNDVLHVFPTTEVNTCTWKAYVRTNIHENRRTRRETNGTGAGGWRKQKRIGLIIF